MGENYCNHGIHRDDNCDRCEKDVEIKELKEEIKILRLNLSKARAFLALVANSEESKAILNGDKDE